MAGYKILAAQKMDMVDMTIGAASFITHLSKILKIA
jgi:hypothetical protein